MKRNIGIDALKILSMFMVVVLHILGQGGVLETLPQFCLRYNVAWLIEILCLCSVNCFALVTGYLNFEKKYTFKSLISLWFQVIFYTLLLTMVIKYFYPAQINYGYIGKMLFPTMGHSYWYFTAYVGLYLFIPLLNFIVEKADRVQVVPASIELKSLDNKTSVPFRFLSRGDLFHFSCAIFTLK